MNSKQLKINMDTARYELLKLARLPGRIDSEEAAFLLGFRPHDIPILVTHRMLKVLGNPPPNGGRYFASVDVDQLRHDVKWMDKASAILIKHWRNKNDRKARRSGSRAEESVSAEIR
jgi:hypothetical protein